MPFFTQQSYLTECERDYSREQGKFVFRYRDWKPEAQARFDKVLKDHTSCYSIKNRAELKDIHHVLHALNPIMLTGGRDGGFSWSTLMRWREERLSSLVFNSLFRRHPRAPGAWSVKLLLNTPDFVLTDAERQTRAGEYRAEYMRTNSVTQSLWAKAYAKLTNTKKSLP